MIVDPEQFEMQLTAFNRCFPHQTGVTERSIRGNNRLAPDLVVNKVMVSKKPDRVSDRFTGMRHSQYHIVFAEEIYYFSARIVCLWKGIEHPLELILEREPCCRARE